MLKLKIVLATLVFSLSVSACTKSAAKTSEYVWQNVTAKAEFPQGYNYPVFVMEDKNLLALNNGGWLSKDGKNWTRAAEKTNWSPRNVPRILVFKNKLWMIGGGVIDGEKTDNPNSESEVWTSAGGIDWTKSETGATHKIAGTPVVFDDKLWLVGANRNDGFASGVLFSEDGAAWQEQPAPWSPRGAVAVWIFDNKLFMTGGKYSFTEKGEIKFVYSNDVWAMSKKTE